MTRPGPQNAALCEAIAGRGGQAIALPGVVITGRAREAVMREIGTAPARLAIFVSISAVEHGAWLLRGTALANAAVAAIGATTAACLERLGVAVAVQPRDDGYTTEALLAHEELQPGVVANDVVIVRGLGGRELLADTLRERGARIRFAQVYERVRPPPGDAAAVAAHIRELGAPELLTATSQEILHNTVALLGCEAESLRRSTRVVVPSDRIARSVVDAGFRLPPLTSAGADNGALLDAMAAWWSTQNQAPASADRRTTSGRSE